MPIRPRTMWPALIFAASRNERVIGRTITLVVSIKIRNGLSQSGAPFGRRWAVVFFGNFVIDDDRNLSHRGSPRVRVKIKCLDKPKVYGLRPIKLIIMMVMNIVEIIEEEPFKCSVRVRNNWSLIRDVSIRDGIEGRVDLVQNDNWRIKIIRMFEIRSMEDML